MSDTGSPYADTSEMYLVHAVFRREFALLPGLVRAVAAGDVERAGIVADHAELLTVLLHEHHSAEDAMLWPRLLALGQPLPVLPLALRNAGVVPVDLEGTYSEARERSRLG